MIEKNEDQKMLERVLEVEVMDSPAEAREYDAMDHQQVNALFVTDLLSASADDSELFDSEFSDGEILDLGTATAQIPIELCRRHSKAQVLAVDLAENMLEIARANVESAGLAERIQIQRVDAKELPFDDGRFAAVISNSIVHHIPNPQSVLSEAVRVAAADALILFRDLMRPHDERTLQQLVDTYAGDASEHQRQMFHDSLHAALTIEEIRDLIASLGFPSHSVQPTSDRHWTWSARKE